MFFGTGMMRGLWITLKMFFASYFKGSEEGGIFTVEYPEKKLPEKERFRNFPFLVYDENPLSPRCVACDICAKECPPKCIYITRANDAEGKPLKKPAQFDIDATICMNCGICEEVCPFDAIFMDHEYEVAGPDRQDKMYFKMTELLKPNDYFRKIRPNDALEIDTKLKAAKDKAAAAAAAKAQAAAKPPEAN